MSDNNPPAPPPSEPPAATAAHTDSASPDKPAREKKRRLDVNPQLILSEGRSKRRRTPSPPPAAKQLVDSDPKDPERASQLGLQLYNKIMAMRDVE